MMLILVRYASFVSNRLIHGVYVAAEDDRKFVSIIGFECRGMDVVNWHPEVSCVQTHYMPLSL